MSIKNIDHISLYKPKSSPVTIVSGYWRIPNKHGDESYIKWFENTLRIDCPTIFFGDTETIPILKKYRGDLPAIYIHLELKDFATKKYEDKMLTHPTHVPSKELNMIWNEKVYLMEKSVDINPFQSDWFAWVDAGTCSYRAHPPPNRPWPDYRKLETLPRDKVIFTSSDLPHFQPWLMGQYYHYVAGTSFMMYKDVVKPFKNLYGQFLDGLLKQSDWKFTDQVVHTFIYNQFQNLYHHLGHGYGMVVPLLF
jgi:hypothetical protein